MGKHVSVNCILGMSFVNSAKLVIDTSDGVIESKLLEVNPFQITYKTPSKSSPNLVPWSGQADKNLIVKREIEDAYIFVSSLSKYNLQAGIKTDKIPSSITFDPNLLSTKEQVQIYDILNSKHKITQVSPFLGYKTNYHSLFITSISRDK